jgi:hypothetical protein
LLPVTIPTGTGVTDSTYKERLILFFDKHFVNALFTLPYTALSESYLRRVPCGFAAGVGFA